MADIFPVPEASGPVRSTWGAPRSGGRRHQGIDIFAPMRSPVLAPFKGRLLAGEGDLGGYFAVVAELRSDRPTRRRVYLAHLAEPVQGHGRIVYPGERIGSVGTTGNAEGKAPHVHLELREGITDADPDGEKVDPAPWLLAVLRGEGATAETVMSEQDALRQQVDRARRLSVAARALASQLRPYSTAHAELVDDAADMLMDDVRVASDLASEGGYREGTLLLARSATIAVTSVEQAMRDATSQSWWRLLMGEEQFLATVRAFDAAGALVQIAAGGFGLGLVALAVGFLLLSRK